MDQEIDTTIGYLLPKEMIREKELSDEGMRLLTSQWRLFNELSDYKAENNLKERRDNNQPELTKGTLVHGTEYDIDKLLKIKETGIVSGELIGIPEQNETNYCADFFVVPEDMSIKEYLEWCRQFEESLLPIKKKRGESDYLPTSAYSETRKIGFIVDSQPPEIQPLLANDAYSPNAPATMANIVTQLPREPQDERTAAILVGIPSNFINGMVIGSGITNEELSSIKETMGYDILYFNVEGQIL